MRSHAVRTVAIFAVLAVASCFRDSTGLRYRPASFGFRPVFSAAAIKVVDFERVRIRLYHPGTTDLAKDTTVSFPANADSMKIPLTVQLQSGATSEDFDLTLAMINAAGDTVFRGGPTRVTATMSPGGSPAPEVPIVYVGVGSTAAGVRWITTPATAFFGDTVVFAAQAFDSSGTNLPGTPIVYSVNVQDSSVASVPDPSVGRVVAKAKRGSAGVVAALLTGPSASATLKVQPKPNALAIVSGNGQTGTAGSALAQPLVVRVTAADGLGVQNVSVAFAATAGGGSLLPAAPTTDSGGKASLIWTLGPSAGTNTATATVTGITPVTFTATGTPASGIGSTTVTPKLDTLTALTATVQLSVQAKDTTGKLVTGSFTWVSRAPAIATVSAGGLVAAAANGSTYVVATEAGGTRDSALIVVQQRFASINVTPASRNIYIGANYIFTATAVDGLGQPIAAVTAFTWSSTASAVASVDASTGKVTGAGLGTAQIRATSGVITGVANVSIITQITRIAVVVDTLGAVKTDTFSMPSLGLTRRYRAIAHDTLDGVMSGVAFTWASTNGSVAVMNTTAGDTASVTSAANGVTKINASAQGFTSNPGASLTVSQVLASIQLSPPASNPTATIAIKGSVGLVARGLDANQHYISGGSFTYASRNTAIATVDAATGVVTGVGTGVDTITASSGTITSNVLAVTVGGSVPAIISFGRDTVSVGRGSSASIPILLSTPTATGGQLTVNLAATPNAYAHWSASSVVIPAGQTSANATLVGDSAGTTTVTASDGSDLGYSTGSAVARVTANMRLTTSSYAINATDIASTQVLLSDPSPAGGTYVTFNYSTPGIALVSPDPAFIPAGQLAADIQVHGLAAGTTNITPNAIGVNGAASSFTAYAPVLTPSIRTEVLGQGQNEPNVYVYLPTYTNVPVQVTLSSSDTTVVGVTPTVTVPANSYYAYFTISANTLGSATITLSATGWTAASTIGVTSTTPRVGICCGGTLNTTSPQTTLTVYSEDSLSTGHYQTNSLAVHLYSRDTTVMRVIDTLVVIQPGTYYNTGRIVPGGLGGTTWIIATASGHNPDSAQYTVGGPKLQFSWVQNYIGTGQYDPNEYVYTPNNVAAPLVVSVANSNPTSVTAPTADTIPTGTYYRYFTVAGNATGTATFIATAPGYQPDTASYTVTSPRLTACCNSTVNNFGPGTNVTVYTADSLRTTHYRTAPLAVSVVSLDPTIIAVDSSVVTVDSGTYYNSRARVTPVGVGTGRILFTAAGHVTLDTLTITVQSPKIQFSFTTATLGRRQSLGPSGNGFYIYTPDNRTSALAATITQKQGSVDTLTTKSPTIAASTYYAYLDAFGLAYGTDTLILAAPGYVPDTAFVTVTTAKFTSCCMPGTTTTTNPPLGITVYTTDSLGNGHYAMDTVAVAATSSDTTVIRPVQPSFPILKGTYYTSTSVNVVGPGAATITYSDAAGTGYLPTTTGSVTVTGPALTIANSTPVLGMRQTSGTNGTYVYAPNSVATDLVVNLVSTDPRVVTVPASVTIPAGNYYAYFQSTAQDTVGTIQVRATATGYTAGTSNVQVTQPKFVITAPTQLYTTSAPQSMTVYAADANGTAHYTSENVAVTLFSTAQSVAAIDSATITIPAGQYYSSAAKWGPPLNGVVGTSQLQASDSRAAYYKYDVGTLDVAVVTPTLGLYGMPGALGIGQYQDNAYASAPDYVTAPTTVTFTHAGQERTGTYTNLTNTPITQLTIPQGSYYQYFRIAGLAAGIDTLVGSITSPTYNPDTAYTLVGTGRVDPLSGWPSTIKAGDSVLVTLYTRDPNGVAHNVVAATQFNFTSVANVEFWSGGANSTQLTSVTVPADAQYVQFYLKGKTAGAGSVTITATNYQSYTSTVQVQ